MKNFKYLIFAGIALSSLGLVAQVAEGSIGYYRDALLFGQASSTYGNTARMQGIGGATTSLGADMSAAGANPAGLGFYNRNVFSFTPSLNMHNAQSSYLGSNVATYKNNFNFANLGIVFNNNKGDYTDEKFKGGSFAITLNRTNDFNNEVTYQGRNANNSIIDAFIQDAGTQNSSSLSGLSLSGYENYLISPVLDDNDVVTGYDSFVIGYPMQSETITTRGGQYDLNFSWGGNYNDKVYFGAGLGFVSLDYKMSRNYLETDFFYTDDNGGTQVDDWINSINVKDDLSIDGSGINGSIGLIARPVDYLTVGVSYKTATFYSLNEESGFTNSTNWNGVELDDNGETIILNERDFVSDLNIGQYNMRTPGRLNLGATAFLGKLGFITGDVEFVDFGSAQLKSSDFTVFADNQSIMNLYTRAINYRLGAEFRYDNFRFRGGYAYFSDPYRNNDNFDGSRQNLSIGAGFRTRDYFVDLAVVNMKRFDAYSPYNLNDGSQPLADITNRSTNISATVGFNF
ncbi:MAG: hypothetical protein ACI83W_000375 [Marinoscillum sp.]|jgi:hypothetical protein